MTDSRDELVRLNDERTPDALEVKDRSVDEARTEVKKRLWFTPVALLIIALIGFILGDWIYVAIMGGLLGIGVVRLVGELKEPQRYLQIPPRQLVGRILKDREFWETRGKELGDTGQLMRVQDLLDGLSLGESWLRRNNYHIAKWSGILATVVWLVVAVIMLVAGDSVGKCLVSLGAASLFGAGAVGSARAESKRREAVELLEEVREKLVQSVKGDSSPWR